MQDFRHYSRSNAAAYHTAFSPRHTRHTRRTQRVEHAQRAPHTRHARRLGCAATLLLAAVLTVLLGLGWLHPPSLMERVFAPRAVEAAAPGAASTEASARFSAAEPLAATSEFTVALPLDELDDTGFLRLVNDGHPYGAEGEASTAAGVSAGPPALSLKELAPAVQTSARGILLHEAALASVVTLDRAAREAGLASLVVNSGYRSYAEQAALYAEALDPSYVQQAGLSEHHTGLAVDLEFAEEQADEASGWLAGNSWRYGLILRYDEAKQPITQIAYEPWHYRYLGTVHAWYCWKYALCLEEYLAELCETGGYQVSVEARSYYVSYQMAQDGVLYVPNSLDFEVSSDGCGGFIVTAWTA